MEVTHRAELSFICTMNRRSSMSPGTWQPSVAVVKCPAEGHSGRHWEHMNSVFYQAYWKCVTATSRALRRIIKKDKHKSSNVLCVKYHKKLSGKGFWFAPLETSHLCGFDTRLASAAGSVCVTWAWLMHSNQHYRSVAVVFLRGCHLCLYTSESSIFFPLRKPLTHWREEVTSLTEKKPFPNT